MMITRDGDWTKMFNRRAVVLGGAQAALVAVLVGRMYYLQVVQADRYRMLAEDNRINIQLIPPPRGRIVDRFGEPLAINKQQFRALVVPEQVQEMDDTLRALGQLVDISVNDHKRIKKEVGRRRGFVPITVKENLTWDEMTRIQVNAPDLPGVVIDEAQTRFYPRGKMAAQLLGYVASVDESDLTGDPLLQLPGFRIGKDGIEKVYDIDLRGTGGTSQVEVNAYGRVIRELERKEGNPGADIALTIDERLQNFAANRLDAESAAVVLMDVHTGDLLAMVSNPSFDVNAFARGLTVEEWEAISTNNHKPLVNKTIAGQFSPGSTFKMIVALAALEHGVISRDQTVHCNGSYALGRYVKRCHKVHGSVNMVRAISVSCDVYFYEVARRLGVDKIADMATRMGLGQLSGINLPGEQRGLIPTEAWKMAARGEPWMPGDDLNVGIGQGDVLVTPIQLATFTSRIANGGFAVQPQLVLSAPQMKNSSEAVRKRGVGLESLGIDAQHLDIVKQGMYDVVNGPVGATTAASFGRLRLEDPEMKNWKLSGKTGTTQVYHISAAEREAGKRKPEDRPWHLRDNALFVAYAPSHQPRYAIAVVVQHALGGGGTIAAPIARDIMEEALRLDPSRRPRVDENKIASAAEIAHE
ncbi:MAG TPA: penicillin-binding protein 2 [Rhodospirillaceae bacterium]|nr:penicillin-binding protein 2 [Rhodospirillaceae bacterium]